MGDVLEALNERQRREFVAYLHSTFKYTIGANNKTIQDLLDISTKAYRKLPFDKYDLQQLLYFIGWIPTEDAEQLPIITNVDAIPDVAEIVACYTNFENHLATKQKLMAKYQYLSYKGEIYKKTGQEDVAEVIADNRDALDLFYTTWCVNSREKSILKGIATKYWRCPFKTLYSTYCEFCFTMGFQHISKKELLLYIESKGHKRSKGYANGVSGTSFFYGLYVPGCANSLEVVYSKRFKQCVISVNRRLYTKQGDLIAKFDDSDMQDTIKSPLDKTEIGIEDEAQEAMYEKSIEASSDDVLETGRENVRQMVVEETNSKNDDAIKTMSDEEFERYAKEYRLNAEGSNNADETIEYLRGYRERFKSLENYEIPSEENDAPLDGEIEDDTSDKIIEDEIDPATEEILRRYNLQDYGKE